MPLYSGSKQTFRNRYAGNPIREIYFGNSKVMGFNGASYSANEIVGGTIGNSSVLPTITGNGTTIVVSTTDYTSGNGYTKYYCDYMEYTMFYSANVYVFDSVGNQLISVECSDSWSFMEGKWTVTCKVTMFGSVVYNTENKTSSMESGYLTCKLYYDLTNKQWVFERNGQVARSGVVEWQPTYFCVRPFMWFMISTYVDYFFDGSISITNMNKAVGYPNAR